MATQSHPDIARILGRTAAPRTRDDFDIRSRCITTGLSLVALIAVLMALFLL